MEEFRSGNYSVSKFQLSFGRDLISACDSVITASFAYEIFASKIKKIMEIIFGCEKYVLGIASRSSQRHPQSATTTQKYHSEKATLKKEGKFWRAHQG